MSCNNCNNNELLNDSNSGNTQSTTGSIKYDGINFTCTGDPSLDTVTNDSLNTIILRLLNSSCEGGGSGDCCISTVTYEALSASIASGTLIQNSVYRFPYYTRHLINGGLNEYNNTTVHHDNGTGVKNTFTPETEYLLARAISSSEIALEVYSESHPRDIIYYNHKLNKTEDNLQDRPGFITFRHDVDNDVSAPFDFRNVLHRRWDLDIHKDRDTEYNAYLEPVTNSVSNHQLNYRQVNYVTGDAFFGDVPPFANYDNNGNSTYGVITTTNETGTTPSSYRDFKTFVSYDTELFYVDGTLKDKPRYKNIHIKKCKDVSKITGSGTTSAPVEIETTGFVGSPFASVANVVIFTRSAENIYIGQNASGVTITGRQLLGIDIGDNSENIIIGGSNSKPNYAIVPSSPLEPKIGSYNNDIKIGNSNRDVFISDNQRRITIGEANVGILFMNPCINVTVGSHNTSIYGDIFQASEIKDFNQRLRISNTGGAEIGSANKNIDIVNAAATQGEIWALGKDVPDGISSTIEQVMYGEPLISIGNGCSDLFLGNSAGIKLGDKCRKGVIASSKQFKIGHSAYNFNIWNCSWVEVGIFASDVEFNNLSQSSLGDYIRTSKFIYGSYIKTGNSLFNVFVGQGAKDVTLGSEMLKIFILGLQVTLEGNNSEITVRGGSNYCKIGKGSKRIYLEMASHTDIGMDCKDIVLNTGNVIIDPSFPSNNKNYWNTIQKYNWASPEPRVQTYLYEMNYLVYEYLSGLNILNPLKSVEYNQKLSDFIGYSITTVPSNTKIGNNCNDIYIVSSEKNVINSNSSNIYIGTDTIVTYALDWVNGLSDAANSAIPRTVSAIQALFTSNTGGNCNSNIIGINSSNIKFYGIGKNENVLPNYCPGITVTLPKNFNNNTFIVTNFSNTTLSNSISYKVFDKSDGSDIWEQSINSSGVLQTPTKFT